MSAFLAGGDQSTVAGLIARGTAVLAGSDSARLDCELLLAHATGLDRTALYREPDRRVAIDEQVAFAELVGARAGGRPIAQLTGTAEFWSLRFEIDGNVLVPRPETERLVELALEYITESTVVADLGCGSGAIAAAIAFERPRTRILASDADAAALAVAQRNAARLCPKRVHFLRSDWLDAYGAASIDVLVSNPPYVAAADPLLADSDIRFEPIGALAAGNDGLASIRRIVADAPRVLAHDGWLLLEHGYNQGNAVRALLCEHGFGNVTTASDLAGCERVTSGRLSSDARSTNPGNP